jgi:ankyrin repeat protein
MSNELIGAVKSGKLKAIQAALAAGASLEARNGEGRTPLLALCWSGSGRAKLSNTATTAALLLIERGANVRATDDDKATPLHWAASSHAVRVIDALAARGARATKDAQCHTPLFYCIDRRGRDRDTHLWDRLFEIGCQLEDRDHDGQTPLVYAATYGNYDAVKYLLAKGAKPQVKDAEGKTALDRARELNLEPVRKRVVKLLATDRA